MSTYSVGQMNQLGDALEAAGFTPDEVTKLRSSRSLQDFRSVLLGVAEVKMIEHIIDLDKGPYVPDGWTVEEQIKGGQFEWDPAKVQLYLSKHQQDDKRIGGHQLREELRGKPVLNANLLDWLLAHQKFIPESWKGEYIFFWGTIYRDAYDDLLVRCLYWDGCRWHCSLRWLGEVFRGFDPAAVPAT